VLLVDAAHECGGWREGLIDEDEDGFLGRQLDALADDIDELADRQVRGHQVLLLVDGGDVALFHLLADDLYMCARARREVSDVCFVMVMIDATSERRVGGEG
jgi:hypothetical protein